MANFIKNENIIDIGGPLDYCYLCAKEIESSNRDDFYNKFNNLKGKIEGQPVLKIKKRGDNTCICKEHIKQIYGMMCPQEIGVMNPQEVTDSKNLENDKKNNSKDKKKDK